MMSNMADAGRLTAAFGGALSPFPFQREGFSLIAVSLFVAIREIQAPKKQKAARVQSGFTGT